MKNIENITTEIFEEKTKDEYIEQLMDLTQTMKESTIYQIYHEPENFVKKDEINCDESLKMFIQGILSSYLDENGVYNVIQKKPDNDNTSKALIQSIFSGEAFNQVINFSIE